LLNKKSSSLAFTRQLLCFVKAKNLYGMKRIFIIPLFFFLFAANFLQGQSSFSKSYYLDNGISSDVGANIQNYEDGFLLLVGRNGFGHDHVGLAKTNLSGDPEWTNIYYLENQQTPPDPGLSMAIDEDRIYICASFENGGVGRDIQLLCISGNTKDTLWIKSYPNPLEDEALYMIKTPDNNLLIVSTSKKPDPGVRMRLTKVDISGNVLWDKFFDDFKTYIPGDPCISQDGNILISGSCIPYNDFSEKAVLTKVDLSGNKIWQKTYDNTEKIGAPPTVTPLLNGGYAFGWTRDTFGPGGLLYVFPPIVYILDAGGNIQTSHTFYNRWRRDLSRLRTLPDGDILGVGMASGHPDSFSDGGWLFRMSAIGELRWQRAIRDTRYLYGLFYDATETPDGGILATGYQRDSMLKIPLWLFKIGGNGCYEADCGDLELLVSPSTEIPLDDGRRYSIYPNPTRSVVQLLGTVGDERQLEVFNAAGQLVLQANLPQPDGLSVQHLPAGHYTVKISLNNNHFTTIKFIKI
jgi:hypothetical protein